MINLIDLPTELRALQGEIESYARDFGLDFAEIRYHMLDYRMINQIAAYDGFPTRYPHWRFGMEYERLSKSFAYGLHRIYEMVINTEPVHAYLLASNNHIDQKLVMAHVCGHADFFKNNMWFSHTNRKMLDEMANHASRIRRHIARHGQDKVENFIDACLSLENLIDIHSEGIRRRPIHKNREKDETQSIHRLPAKDYMDTFINPPEYLEEQRRRVDEAHEKAKKFPAEPEQDVLLFLLEHAPLENWQHDILDIVREEAYYFAPQRQTKIMNEGFASYIHTHIMTHSGIMTPNEVIDYADHHSGTVATHAGRLNPYKLGLELFRDIKDRWDRGAFGKEYENCRDMEARKNWDLKLGLGRGKVLEVRRVYNDIGFIDAFLTEDFARAQRLFNFDFNHSTNYYEISSRQFDEVKKRLLFQLTNFGQPIIEIENANYKNRGELYLMHRFEGIPLDIPYAQETLGNLYKIWGRPVHLESVVDEDNRRRFSHKEDGSSRSAV